MEHANIVTYWHVNLLPRKKTLLLKAKALYFIEVNRSLWKITLSIGVNIVGDIQFQKKETGFESKFSTSDYIKDA